MASLGFFLILGTIIPFIFFTLVVFLIAFFIIRSIRKRADDMGKKIDNGGAGKELLKKTYKRFLKQKISNIDLSHFNSIEQNDDSIIDRKSAEKVYDFFVNGDSLPGIISEVIWTKKSFLSNSSFRALSISRTKNDLVKTEIKKDIIYSYLNENLVGTIDLKNKSIFDPNKKKIGSFHSPDFYISNIRIVGKNIRNIRESTVKVLFEDKKCVDILLSNSFMENLLSVNKETYNFVRINCNLSKEKIAIILSFALFVKINKILNYSLRDDKGK